MMLSGIPASLISGFKQTFKQTSKVWGGMPEDNRVVDLWDCDTSSSSITSEGGDPSLLPWQGWHQIKVEEEGEEEAGGGLSARRPSTSANTNTNINIQLVNFYTLKCLEVFGGNFTSGAHVDQVCRFVQTVRSRQHTCMASTESSRRLFRPRKTATIALKHVNVCVE